MNDWIDSSLVRGAEPTGREVVELIRRTGGVAVLAHPWSLKSPNDVIEDLRAVGLHGVEVYRKGGKATGWFHHPNQRRYCMFLYPSSEGHTQPTTSPCPCMQRLGSYATSTDC